MTHKTVKFGSADNIKFIKLYKSYDCLWNTKNKYYKNRDARNAALKAFTTALEIEDFGPKEITAKIKNMRSQYLQERKKVKSSLKNGADAENVYVPKLPWYNILDSFLNKSQSSEFSTTILKTDDSRSMYDQSSSDSSHDEVLQNEPATEETFIQYEDDVDIFGKYVIASLRKLSQRNMILAQDEIQSTLSKYKLKNLDSTFLKTDSDTII